MGFQDMSGFLHKLASSKGGKVRKKKGLASLPPEKRREIASKGGKASASNRSKRGTKQTQEDRGGSPPILERVPGDLDDIRD